RRSLQSLRSGEFGAADELASKRTVRSGHSHTRVQPRRWRYHRRRPESALSSRRRSLDSTGHSGSILGQVLIVGPMRRHSHHPERVRRTRDVVTLAAAIVTVTLACPPAFALNPTLDVSQYAHTTWKIRDGFTRGTIQAIAQTPDGYLWLG